ncbi:MAG: hypothetical protein ABI193_19435, partial [Minicystis sp.]
MDLAARSRLAESLLGDNAVAAVVTEAFFARHPEWDARFGPAGRRRCTEDARLHLSFLAGAVQVGNLALFAEYMTWCAAMLGARKIDGAHLAEHLDLLEEQLALRGTQDARPALDPAARALISAVLCEGHAAL